MAGVQGRFFFFGHRGQKGVVGIVQIKAKLGEIT